MKRTLSVVLSVLMILSCCSALFAVFAEGPQSGTYPILSALGYGEDDITILAGKIEGKESTTVVERSAYTHASDYLPGDANGNKKIDAQDYAMIKRHYLKTYTLAEDQFQRSDINLNGKIDAAEYAMVKRHYLGNYKLPESVEIAEPGKTYDDYVFIVVGADNKVISVDASENSKGETAIPEGGYIIGFNKKLVSGDAAKYDISAIKEGTELKLEGVTVEEVAALTAPKALENASFSVVTGEILVDLPAEAIAIDFVGYEHAAATSLVAGDGQTIGEITARGNKTNGVQKDMNYAYNILVNKDNVVIATDYKIGVACPFQALPEGAYIISYNCNKAGYEVMADIKVGDIITLYNVDPAEARTIQGSRALTQAGFTYAPAPQPDVYELEIDVDEDPVLTDGVTGFEGGWGDVGTSKVHLAQNAECTEKAMSVSLIKKFDAVKVVRSITLDLYHDANVMIGYPEGKAVVYASADGTAYDLVGEYELAAAELELGKHGTVSTKLDLGSVTAKAVKVVLYVGSSTEVLGENPAGGKVFWEFISIAEFAVEADEGIDLLVSHLNLFNWTTFEAMLIIKTDTISTVMDIPNSSYFDAAKNIMYVVELQDGKYIATKFVNDESMKTTEAPANGFLLFLNPANAGYELGKDGALLNAELVIMDFTLEGTLVIDTNANPEKARHILVVKGEEPAEIPENLFWLTHYENDEVEGAGVVFQRDFGKAWWGVYAFKPIEGVENGFELAAIAPSGATATTLTCPEGGFVYAINTGNNWPKLIADNNVTGDGSTGLWYDDAEHMSMPNYVSAGVSAMWEKIAAWKVGDKFIISGVDLADKKVPTSTPDKQWYEESYVCTATIDAYAPGPELTTIIGAKFTAADAENAPAKVHILGTADGENYFDLNAGNTVGVTEGVANLDFSTRARLIVTALKAVDEEGKEIEGTFELTKTEEEGVCPEGPYPLAGLNESGYGNVVIKAADVPDGIDINDNALIKSGPEGDKILDLTKCQEIIAEEVEDGVYMILWNDLNDWQAKKHVNTPEGIRKIDFKDGIVKLAENQIILAIMSSGSYGTANDGIYSTTKWIARGLKAGDLISFAATEGGEVFSFAIGEPYVEEHSLFEDEKWAGEWITTVPGENAGYQNAGSTPAEDSDEKDRLLYDYKYFIEDGVLYVGAKFNQPLTKGTGNGNSSFFRVWLKSNPEAAAYTHFYDVYVNADDEVVFTGKRNKALDANSGEAIADTKATGVMQEFEGHVEAYAAIPLTEINATDYLRMYVNCAIEKATGGATGNQCLLSPALATDEIGPLHITGGGKNQWLDSVGNIGIKVLEPAETGDYEIKTFAGYASGDVNLFVRLATGEKTLNDIGNKINGREATDYNAYAVIVVNKDGKVVYVDLRGPGRPAGVKGDVEVPEGGFVIGFNRDVTGYEAIIELKDEQFIANGVKFGDTVKLYGVDLAELANATTTELTGASFDIFPGEAAEPFEAVVKVNENAILTDGKTGFDGNWGTVGTGDVLLVANSDCKKAPMVVSIIDELEAIKNVSSITVDLYHCANVMIGYPEGKAVVSVSEDGDAYTVVGTYDLAASELALGQYGTVQNKFEFDPVEAKFVKVELEVGSNFLVLGGTPADDKYFWEFISIAEVSAETYDLPLDFEWVESWTEVKGENVWEWQLNDAGKHSFDYAVQRDGDNFRVGVKYHGDLYAVENAGAANGNDLNGKATNLRIWMFDPNNTVGRANFTALLDIGYNGTEFVIDRVDDYGMTKVGKMIGDAIVFEGSFEAAILKDGAEISAIIPSDLISADGGAQFILTVSTPEADGTHNTALFSHSINNEGSYKAAWNPWDSEHAIVFEPTTFFWGEPTWEWTDVTAATATFEATNLPGKTEKVDAVITSETKAATIYAAGATIYTAKVTFKDTEYTDTKEEPIEKLAFTPEALPADAFNLRSFGGYFNGDVNLFVRLASGEYTLNDIGNKLNNRTATDYNAYKVFVVDKDGNVVEIYTNIGRADVPHSEGDGRKDLVEVPEGGFAIGVSVYDQKEDETIILAKDDAALAIFDTIQIGDKVELYNVDVDALALLGATIRLEDYQAGFTVKNTIDGVFEGDPIWEGAEWIHVDETNGTWQNVATRGTFTYDYMLVEDDTYVYVAVKADTDAITMTRMWMRTNAEAQLYTHFIDVNTDGTFQMKKNSSLTANSGVVVADNGIVSKVAAADGKYVLEYRFPKEKADITAEGIFEYRFNVTTGGTTTLHSASMLWGNQNGKSTFPWASWTDYELSYVGLVPKTNRWKINEGANFGPGTIQQLFFQEDEFIVKNDQGWPNVEFHYPEADRQTYEIDKYALYYDFTVTGNNNITLFFTDSTGKEYSFPLANSALYLNTNQYETGSGDFKAGEFKGFVPLADLVKAFNLLNKNQFPAGAVEDGTITFSGVQVWVSGAGAACNLRELAVKEYTAEGLEFAWAEEWKEANGVTAGTWQESSVPGVPHSYEYAAAYDAETGNVKLGVKFHGILTGTADAYGNGKGTNIRVWIRNPGTGYTAYNFFADVSYNGTEWLTCIKQNTNPTGNSGTVVADYNAESYPYTLTTMNTARGADIEITFPATLVSDSGVVQIIFAVSNKDAANYCLYHGAAGGSAAWNPWNGDQSINLSGAPMPEISTSSGNLALNKECTMGGNYSTSGTYMGKMTDGVSATAGSYTGVWHAFKIGEVTADINLGEVYENVNKVRVNIWPANKSGIVPPKSVKFYVSEDGTNYTEAGMLDMSDSRFKDNSDTAYWFETDLYTAYKAQYVKMVVDTQKVYINGELTGAFSFFAEVEVYAVEAAEYIQPTHGYTYATDSLNVIGYKLGKTLGEVKDKTHAWWNLAVVEWDLDEKAYVVKEVLIGNGTDSDFHDVEIPLYGFVLGCHNTEMPEAAAFIAGLTAGDKLYLYDIDVNAITEVDVALSENAMVSKDLIDGKTAYDPGVKLGAYKITNFAKYATGNTIDIFVRQEGKTTLGDLEGKDYNYFKIIVVNEEGMVIDVNEKLGRAAEPHSPEDGRKDLVEIPEGGYIIGLHNDAIAAESSVYADLFGADGVKCGDTVTLRNVDLEELAALEAGTALNKYASFDVAKKAFTSVTSANGRWQTVKETSPELLTYKLALADDEEYLYVTVVGDGKFADEISTFRFWIRSSDDATVYTHFYDVDIAADGAVTNKAKYNKSLTTNSGDNIAESSMVYAASAIGETQTKITFKVLLSEFNGADGFAYYAALMKKGVDYSYYPAPEGTGTATMPYQANGWDIRHEGLYNKDRMEQPGTYKLRSFAGYANGDVNLFVRINDGETVLKTLNEIGNLINNRTTTDYNAYKVFTVDADGFVTGVYTNIGRAEVPHSEGDGRKDLVEVPEGGFAIGVSVYDGDVAKDDAALAIFDTLKVGDYVELCNVDIDEVAESHHVNAYASFNVQFLEAIPEGAYSITHFGLYKADICSILVPLASGEKTVGDITKVTMGSKQNFTWWNGIVVGADGKITKVIGMVDKTNVEIPEGGFMLIAHGSHPALNALGTAAVGEIATLYNVDRAALANTWRYRPLVKAAFTIQADPSIVRPVSYQKSYTVTGNTRTDSYKDDGVKLTDGKYSDNGGTAASSGFPMANNPTVTVDLGEAMDVDLFKVHSAANSGWGITLITGFTVEISTDGTAFTPVEAASTKGDPADATWQSTWFTIQLDSAVNARYIKFVPVGGNYLWADEVEAWAPAE